MALPVKLPVWGVKELSIEVESHAVAPGDNYAVIAAPLLHKATLAKTREPSKTE